MRALVTDSHSSVGVAAVRSLGRRGVEALAGWHSGTFPLAATSRHCRGTVRLPDPMEEPERFGETIAGLCQRGEIDAILPVSDAALAACEASRLTIESRAVYCAASPEALSVAEDKWAILERARTAGLAAPQGLLVEPSSTWEEWTCDVEPPVVLRSRRSLLREGTRLRKPPSYVAFDRDAFRRNAGERVARGESFVITPYHPGTGRGLYLFMVGGRATAAFGHLRLRETNPTGSPACAAIPWAPTEEVTRAAETFLARLGVDGAAMIECRRAAATGEEWLVEVNPRLWGSVPLAIVAGLDFPWWQLRYFAFGERPPSAEVDPALVGCRFLSAELGHLLHAFQGPPPSWRGPYPSRTEAWRGFLEAFHGGWRYYHQCSEDPLPGIAEPLAFVFGRLGRSRR